MTYTGQLGVHFYSKPIIIIHKICIVAGIRMYVCTYLIKIVPIFFLTKKCFKASIFEAVFFYYTRTLSAAVAPKD